MRQLWLSHNGSEQTRPVKHLTGAQVKQVKRMFNKFDADNTGYIDRDEFLAHYHKDLPLFGLIDQNGDGLVSQAEFVEYFDAAHDGSMRETEFWRNLTLLHQPRLAMSVSKAKGGAGVKPALPKYGTDARSVGID